LGVSARKAWLSNFLCLTEEAPPSGRALAKKGGIVEEAEIKAQEKEEKY